MKILLFRNILLAAGLTAFAASADVITDARALMDEGEFAAAAEILRPDPALQKGAKMGEVNQLLGQCEYELGNFADARRYLDVARTKGVAAASLYLARIDYLEYKFSDAAEAYAHYRTLMKKAKKSYDEEELEDEEARVAQGENFLERVEKIAVIDSIRVPAEDFFKSYRLPASAGSLHSPDALPFPDRNAEGSVYVSEAADRMMWAEPDTAGKLHIMESMLLTDGSWMAPNTVGESLSEEGDANFPFMMADGVTLYFASNGPESMGGYDIFRANRDAATGEFMQPQNMGMPYNSPYNDYLLAIDELNGVGWWATDRNAPAGYVTIYVFVPNELRRNYDPETDDVAAFARLSDIAATQEGKDFSELRSVIAAINPEQTELRKPEFHFPVAAGVEYTHLDDFRDPAARRAMSVYMRQADALATAEKSLADARRAYAAGRVQKERVAQMELAVEKQRAQAAEARSAVYKALLGVR